MTETCFDTCDDIDSLTLKNCSFALYRLPSADEPVLLIQTTGSPVLMHSLDELEGRTGFLFSPFYADEDHPVILMQPDVKACGWAAIAQMWQSPEMSRTLRDLPPQEDREPDKHSTYSFAHYSKAFSSFIRPLSDQVFDKLVLSRQASRKRNETFSPMRTFRLAAEKYPEAFVYLFHSPASGTWFGCTPEVLLTRKSGRCHTMALAGTQKTNAKELHLLPQWDEKNLTEQEIVSDFIRQQLTECEVEWKERGPYTVQAGKVAHLLTDFHFSLPAEQVLRLIRLLYPSPAICGLPQREAHRFILENEGCDREYYSGIVGWLEPENETSLYINLRCMHIGAELMTLYAGGGLLSSSRVTVEWKETQDKLQTLLALIK